MDPVVKKSVIDQSTLSFFGSILFDP
ncbi:uncharacterized protein METZ01_LOCUS307901 [marine metagenome]|uniref:Uncharacterized protein n=1 Tax=marine metagenome TaxID=408172 RepID=A0A382N4E2_9ZZZZ